MSGVVTDETGSPLSGIGVEVQYLSVPGGFSSSPPNCPFQGNSCWFVVKTSASGFYDVAFDARQSARIAYMPNVGTIAAFGPHSTNLQIVPVAPATIVQNLRLTHRAINVGQQTTITVDPDSSLCTDHEDWFVLTYRCETVTVSVGQSGTLVVEARGQGGVVPRMFWATTGNYNGVPVQSGGTLSIPVRSGSFTVFVGTPVGSGVERFDVLTELR